MAIQVRQLRESDETGGEVDDLDPCFSAAEIDDASQCCRS